MSGRLEQALVLAGERVIRVAAAADGAEPPRRAPGRQVRSDRRAAPSHEPCCARASSASRPRSWTSARWRSACSPTTAPTSWPSAPASRTACAGTCSISAPIWRPSCRCARSHQPRALDRITRKLRQLPATDRGRRIARQLVSSIRQLTRHADAIETELRALVRAHSPQAAGRDRLRRPDRGDPDRRTAGAERFVTEASFAHQAGTAPIPASSGNRTRHRLHRGGDRQLNRAAAHDRHHPRRTRPRDPRLHPTQDRRRQDPPRSHPLPQTPPRPPLLPTPRPNRRSPTPTQRPQAHAPQHRLLDIDGMCRAAGSVLADV